MPSEALDILQNQIATLRMTQGGRREVHTSYACVTFIRACSVWDNDGEEEEFALRQNLHNKAAMMQFSRILYLEDKHSSHFKQ